MKTEIKKILSDRLIDSIILKVKVISEDDIDGIVEEIIILIQEQNLCDNKSKKNIWGENVDTGMNFSKNAGTRD